MANPDHLKILSEGVSAWNQWRMQAPDVRADLRGAKLTEAQLAGVDFSGAALQCADLSRAKLGGSNLQDVTAMESNFAGADLHAAIMNRADLNNAYILQAKLKASKLRAACLTWCNLSYSDLTDADLSDAIMQSTQLWGTDLTRATLCGAHIAATIFGYAKLEQADFTDAGIDDAIFGHNDLSVAKGLESVEHRGPSMIDIDTIYRSKGGIPEAFLRGVGAPEDFLTYMKSLVGKAIEFYSCFISYSSKDNDFAQRLHAGLQDQGVRCWFAPEDLKIGDKFRTRIGESIRVYDKLMVILSENSIRSPWVEEEVEAAMEKERKQNKLVLFPIRLDDAVMETDEAWASNLRRTRHIGDFRAWKDHDPYQKSFERLLRDLKA